MRVGGGYSASVVIQNPGKEGKGKGMGLMGLYYTLWRGLESEPPDFAGG